MKRGPLILVLLLLLLGYGLRVHGLEEQSFWNDEGNSARLTERSPALIIEGAAGDIHPPGYYLLLAGWRGLAGESEFALRYLSVGASLLAAALTYALGRRLFGAGVGLAALTFTALSPFQVYYAQEARMYALLAALGVASLLLTAEVLTLPSQMQAGRFEPRRAAAVLFGYVMVNVAGLYTHYVFPLLIAIETLVFLLWLLPRSKKGHGLAVWAALQGVTLLLYAPWVGVALRQVIGRTAASEGLLPLAFFQGQAYGVTITRPQALYGVLLLAALAAAGMMRQDAGPPRPLRPAERLSLIALPSALLPVTLFMAGANTVPYVKFLLPANLTLALLAGRGVALMLRAERIPLRAAGGLLGAVVMVPALVGLGNLYADPAYERADYRAMAERIRKEAGTDAAVVLTAPNQWEVFTYYYPDGPGVAPLPDDNTDATLNALLSGYDRIYAIFWGEGQQDPERRIESRLDAEAFPVSDQWYGDVRFVTYAVPAESATEPQTRTALAFGQGGIMLEGYAISAGEAAPGDAIGVTLFWHTEQPIQAAYKVFVHLVGPGGVLVTQHDSQPGGDLRPTPSWEVGETIVDNHGLVLPTDLPPGTYTLITGMYDPASGERLRTAEGAESLTLGTLEVEH